MQYSYHPRNRGQQLCACNRYMLKCGTLGLEVAFSLHNAMLLDVWVSPISKACVPSYKTIETIIKFIIIIIINPQMLLNQDDYHKAIFHEYFITVNSLEAATPLRWTLFSKFVFKNLSTQMPKHNQLLFKITSWWPVNNSYSPLKKILKSR